MKEPCKKDQRREKQQRRGEKENELESRGKEICGHPGGRKAGKVKRAKKETTGMVTLDHARVPRWC